MKEIHSNGNVYKYLNPKNVEIIDGCASLISAPLATIHEPLPPWSFQAPEINQSLSQNDISSSADIYSLGQMIIWILCIGSKYHFSILSKIQEVPPLSMMLSDEPVHRPKLEHLRNLEDLLDIDDSFESEDEFSAMLKSNKLSKKCFINESEEFKDEVIPLFTTIDKKDEAVSKNVEEIIADEEEAIMKELDDSREDSSNVTNLIDDSIEESPNINLIDLEVPKITVTEQDKLELTSKISDIGHLRGIESEPISLENDALISETMDAGKINSDKIKVNYEESNSFETDEIVLVLDDSKK